MEYNTNRESLTIREYGRNIQKMIDYCIDIEDRDERNLTASAIVKVMGQMNNQNAKTHDFEQKLWDHLHIISAFNLDIDSPYPKPPKDTVEKKPEKIEYSKKTMSYPHYGKHIERVIAAVAEMEDGEKKDSFVLAVSNYLKKSYLNWNRESVNDETILSNLAELSNGKLKLNEEFQLVSTSEALSNPRRQKNIVSKKTSNHKYSKKGRRR